MTNFMKINKNGGRFSIGKVLVILLLSVVGCKKFVQLPSPNTELVSTSVYSTNGSAAAAMTSIYDNMVSNNSLSTGNASISMLIGAASDELRNYSTSFPVLPQFYTNSLTSTQPYFWPEIYQRLYDANAVIAGLQSSTGVTVAIKNQLTGEAKFMRAFLLFYAVNLYGDVPLVTTTDYKINDVMGRTPKANVYQQIIADLKDAQNLLSNNYLTPAGITTTDRIRPNKGAATALLARVYLYYGNLTGDVSNYTKADSAASIVISNSSLYSLSTLNNTFLKASLGNNEAIWQLQPVTPGYNTYDGYEFVLTTTAPGGNNSTNPVAISQNLVNAFEPGDQRRQAWVDSAIIGGTTYYYPYKYKVHTYNVSNPVTEHLMVLRLAEQYLIKAEAEANGVGTGISGAVNDLNIIRNRAGLSSYAGATDKASLLTAILHERQVELFTEWGHRWFDLIRTGNINTIMGPPGNVCQAKGGTWSPQWALLPIPQSEILLNPNLKQNPGY